MSATSDSLMREIEQQLWQQSRVSVWVGVVVVVVCGWLLIPSNSKHAQSYPAVNQPKRSWTNRDASSQYIKHARSLIEEGFRKFAGPFTLFTEYGPLVVLSPEYIDAVNQEPRLSFNAYLDQENLSGYETFRTFREPPPGMFAEAVMKGLTRNLPKFTKALSLEMTECLDDSWADSAEWHEVDLRKDILQWVARLSTRIFIGDRLTKNKEWLRVSIDYTVNCFIGLALCKLFPGGPLRWFAEKWVPHCRWARRDFAAAGKMLAPILAERHAEIALAQKEGRTPNLPDDSIEWFRDAAKGRAYNEVDLQMGLAVAAIHTTSDLLAQSLLNLCAHPELFDPLRQEAVEVLKKWGWQKVALTELRLLDSFLKETQRMKPITMTTMHRTATSDVQLPNDVKIAKGERITISSHLMWSADEYAEPERFDAFRFVELRKQPGLENRSLLVSTSRNHLGFSHGKHACPGRFFAANEVKIAMVHLLLKYDLRLQDASMAQWKTYGMNMMTNDKARVSVRRRRSEVDVEELARQL